MLNPDITQQDGKSVASPNIIAYLALLAWPFVAWQLYRRLDPARALIWTVLGGYLLLPPIAAINLPVVPDFNKESIPNLTALALCLFLLKDRVPLLPDSRPGRALMLMFVLSPFATVLTNGDPIPFELAPPIPGMRIYDSVAAVANQMIFLLPFFLARRYLADDAAMRMLLAALVAAGLAYSLPMLVESRLSPQINIWVYGFFQHDFFQTIRFGGYRPVVFLPHGLWVAFFALMCLCAALVALRRGPAEARPVQLLVVLYLAAMLVVCKSFGPLAYALVLAPLLLFAPRRVQLLVAAVFATIVVAYPLLRGAHLVPVDDIAAFAERLSAERAYSLRFRLENEEVLLAHAAERPWFGWGGYARNLIHDPITGQTLTIADGAWVIQIGTYGWLGYIAEFGLLALPLWLLGREAWRGRGSGAALSPHVCGVALIFAFNLVDLLPNATLIPFTWLMAGALLGHAEGLAAARRKTAAKRPAPDRPRTVI